MKSSELREKYLAFFEAKGCKRYPSSSLIPDDPSMLLTSAGMVQFKPYFLQQKQLEAPFVGATTVQKCVRLTDIDIIGTTGRHQSFFEMLGNFSFGAYFKQEMCAWALEFSTEVLGFDPARLYFSVYLDDDETIGIWKSLGVPEDHITRLGEKDNFWMAGPTGPCGPCSELYYDQGPEVGCGSPDCAPGCDCDRYLEYWNCVFTQFDRQEDGTLVPLPHKNIDTGMGLERTAALLQGVQSNYETDILRGLIAVGERLSDTRYGSGGTLDLSLRICADHARAITFLIADGVLPANEGRGYVLRRLLRRAVRHGQLIGMEPPFLAPYITEVITQMGGPYPELVENQPLIERIVSAEEERFNQTLRQGQSYLDAHLARLDPTSPLLSGKAAFELHDRYGFPIDLTVEIAAEQGVEVDRVAFETFMEEQRERARAAAKDDAWGTGSGVFRAVSSATGPTGFLGYTQRGLEATVLALVVQDASQPEGGAPTLVESIAAGQKAQVILDKTPFYAEMGGQVGDTGQMQGSTAVFTVEDTKLHDGVYAHSGQLEAGTLAVGDKLTAQIDVTRRESIERNHTATHLLHRALKQVLGDHIRQAGSLVAPERLRFDFTHFEAVTPQQLLEVEDLVNAAILEDAPVKAYETSLDEARASGVTALFGEKYGDTVRVLEAGSASRELCGGTHVNHTSQIGFLKITGESSVGANLRRIEAVTGFEALHYMNRIRSNLRRAAEVLKTQPQELPERIEALVKHLQELEAALKHQRQSAAVESIDMLIEQALDLEGYSLVVTRADGLDADGLRNLWDLVHTRLGDKAAVVLGGVTPQGSPLLLAAGASAAIQAGFDAGALIKQIAPLIKGGGGGKPSMAQAGGKDTAGIDEALAQAKKNLGN
ncbi:MAG: alanine--tRNA ligase [Coriobacteriia bacterium]|nr:alanine--tRNA ligase [Coriobacteriia bacterium]